MKPEKWISWRIWALLLLIAGMQNKGFTQVRQGEDELDRKVGEFLKSRANKWHDLNVPYADGKLLYDIILKNKYRNAVEIGTSTGHSGIWIAWALSKTGGKLITIEMDEDRRKEALANFEITGLSKYIDSRLADAHELVPGLSGPIDFVFSDADKDWYLNYFKALDPKLVVGGCFTSHNIEMTGAREFFDYISKLPNYKTTADYHGAGMSVSYKTGK
jgi:caffeoyl-CoA O-methyltransferase